MSNHLDDASGEISPVADRANASLAYDDNGVVRTGPKMRLAPPPPSRPRPPPASPIPPRVAAGVDQSTLLTVAVLTLSKELRFCSAHVGRIIVKYHRSRHHLVMTPLQWTVLKCFEEGRTVPAALKHLIHNCGCIPLCEFYELVLKACEFGILQSSGYPLPEAVSPAPWRFTLPSRAVRPLGVGLLIASVLLLVVNPIHAPEHVLWWLPGWLLLCGAVSAGAVLVAGVVHGADGVLHRPRLILRSPLPRLVIEHDEVLLGGRQLEIDIALAQLAPFAALAAAAAIYAPPLALPLFCGLLWNLSPFGRNPGLRLLRALQYSPRLSTARDFRFPPNQTLLHRLRQRLDPGEIRFLALRAGYAVPWLLLVVFTWAATTRLDLAAAWQGLVRHNLLTILLWSAAGLFVLALAAVVVLAAIVARQSWLARRAAQNEHEARELAALSRPQPGIGELVTFLGETHPFQNLPARRRQLLAEAMRQTPFNADETLIAAGDKRSRLYLLYSGSAQSCPADPRKAGPVLSPGCIVGESVLLNGGAQPADILGVVPGILLSFNHETYDELVAPLIPRHKIEDAVQKITFLRRIALSRHWSAHVLDGFARRAISHSFAYGAILLEEGRENLWFYVLQEGELRVLRDGRKIARLLPGDFFGEISLLQNSHTTAEIVGHVPGRYLAIPKQDFLAFLTQDHALARQFEAIASRRLGRPVFPL